MILTAILAALAAASNAFASVLQRHEARNAPRKESFRLALLVDMARRPLWWLGILGIIGGALFQFVALLTGPLALVQPVMMVELPITLLLASFLLQRPITRGSLIGTLSVTVGVIALVVAVSPSGGHSYVAPLRWMLALVATAGGVAVLVMLGRATRGGASAAALGASAAMMFALTAALMKSATGELSGGGAVAFLTTWQLYATIVAGVAAVFLLQNAYQAGSLVAAQPAITVGDALVSLVLGVLLFEEDLRLGGWLALAIVGLALIVGGAVELSRSPLVAGVVTGEESHATSEVGSDGQDEAAS